MLLAELSVKNFLSFQDAVWSPSRLNVLIGPNASGKSNLVSLLDMIKQSANGSLGEYVQNQGGMESLLWDGQGRSLRIGMRVETTAQDIPGVKFHGSISYGFVLNRRGNTSWYEVDSEHYSFSSPNQNEIILKTTVALDSAKSDPEKSDETRLSQRCLATQKPENSLPFLNNLRSWAIHRSLRTDFDAPVRQSTITRYDTAVSQDGDNLISVLHTLYTNDKSFKEIVDLSMNAAFNNAFEEIVFPPASDQRVQLGIRWKGLKKIRSSASLSDGTLRFLYLLAILENPNPPALVVIEEPEAGLHPTMLPIIAECAVDTSRRSQVVFTTHSPDFLDTFRDTRPAVTVCTSENGKSYLKTLAGDKLDYWMKTYTLGEFHRSGAAEAVR